MKETEIFLKLYSLVYRFDESNRNHDIAVTTNDLERMQAAENMSDKVYSAFWELVHKNFEKELLKQVNNKIGNSEFIPMEYVNTLQELYISIPECIFEYKGYTLERSLDIYKGETYLVYQDGNRYGESINYVDDESAIQDFILCIDRSPANPGFGM